MALDVGAARGRVRQAAGFAVLFVALGIVLGIAGRDIIGTRTLGGAVASVDQLTRETIGTSLSAEDLLQGHVLPSADRTAAMDAAFSEGLDTLNVDRVSVWNRQHWRVFSLESGVTGSAAVPDWEPGSVALQTALARGRTSFEIRPGSERDGRSSDAHGERLSVVVPVSDSPFARSSAPPLVVGAVEVELAYAPIAATAADHVRLFWGAVAILLSVAYVAVVATRPAATRLPATKPVLVTMVIFDAASGGLRHVVAGDGWLAPVMDTDTSAEDLRWWSDLVLDNASDVEPTLIDVRGQEELV